MSHKIGFIGTGTMGLPMAEHLASSGVAPWVFDIAKHSAQSALDKGARWASSPAEMAGQCDTIFLSLPGPNQVEQVVLGTGGLLQHMAQGSAIVDLSTNSVACVRKLEKACRARGVGFIDSPVSGGRSRAADGSLIFMVGGETELVEQLRPALELLSREIIHLGEVGCGTVAKLVNNQLYLCGEILFYESLALASKAGLDLERLSHMLNESGAGGMHSKLVQRVLEGNFDDNTFALGLAEKDVSLALQAGDSLGVPMRVTASAHERFREGLAAGWERENFWACIKLLEQQSGTTICKKEYCDE